MEEKRIYTLLLGSNLGDRQRYMQFSKELIEKKCGRILAASSMHETEAWGKTDQDDFLNQALLIDSTLSPLDFLDEIQEIELALGRQRNEKWGPRTIDIDILAVGQEIIEHERLQVPHPGIPERLFVLEPLVEIAADWIHPLLNRSAKELLDDLRCAST